MVPEVLPVPDVETLTTLRQQAEKGDASAAFKLALHYLKEPTTGAGEAFFWASKAAVNHAEGAALLGVCYYEGIGTEQDYQKAAESFENARRQGDTRVLNALAHMYAEGEGVQQDSGKAMQLAERAVELGVPNAVQGLARYYLEGKIVPRDPDKAMKILREHLEQHPDDGVACYTLAVILNRETEDTQAVLALLKNADALGVEEAWEALADIYYRGVGVPQDYAKAISYMQKLADKGRPEGLVSLAAMHYQGVGVPKNAEKAKELCRMAIERDSAYAPAYRNLAVLLKENARDEQSRAEVERCFVCAAQLNDIDCTVELAREYSSDAGLIRKRIPEALRWCEAALKEYPESPELNCLFADNLCAMERADRKKAFVHYTLAAGAKYPRAVYRLGRAWEEGWAYEQENRQPANQDKAAQYYLQALELGNAEAAGALVRMADLGYTGVEYSPADWVNMLKIGADAGVKGCAAKLAAYYHPKCGQQPDAEISAAWMKIALERDKTPWAMTLRGWDLVAEHEEAASPEKLREAARLFRMAAGRGEAAALAGLGWLHLQENGPLPQNPGKSIELFRHAARMGEPLGAEMIADMCADGDGVKKDWWLSRKWRRYARSIEYRRKDKKTTLIELVD